MSVESKPVLKSHFELSDIPTEAHFAALIDTLQAITVGTDGSLAVGSGATVSADKAMQVGDGTNTIANSLKIGTGITVLGSEPVDPLSYDNGIIFLDSFGYVNIKSGGKIIRLK